MSQLQETSTFPETQQLLIKEQLTALAQKISDAGRNGNPVNQADIENYLSTLQEITREFSDQGRVLTREVREWILSSEGVFVSAEVARELKLSSRVEMKNLSTILRRLSKENLITRTGDKRATYRIIEASMKPMDWEDCDITQTIDFKLPLGFHNLMYLYPRNMIVIAGDTNVGKTAYLLNCVRENADTHEIDYFTNDLTPEELKKRVTRFVEAGMNTELFSRCRFIPRVKDFLDVMHPDRVTIIDYLALTDKFWLVAEDLDQIYNKLRKGICLIAIQKKTGAKLGRGGDFAMERPRLYFTMEKQKINIKKMKNLIDPNKDPNNKHVRFRLWGGCKFVPLSGWQGGFGNESSQEREPGQEG